MNLAEARAALSDMVAATTLIPLLTVDDLDDALDRSQIVDAAGLAPADVGYEPTWDLAWAAAEASLIREGYAAMQGGLDGFTAEGATFKRRVQDWGAVAAMWRRRSTLPVPAGFGLFEIDNSLGYVPRSAADCAERDWC